MLKKAVTLFNLDIQVLREKTDVSEPRVRRKTDDVPAATDQC